MKWIKRLIVVVLVLLVVAVGAVFYFKDAAVKRGVITGGDLVLGQGSTELSSANLGVFGGTLTLSGLKLDNPDEFKQPHFFILDGTDVAVSLGSLLDDTVVVPTVNLDGLHVTAETSLEKGLPKLNLIKIKKTVDQAVGAGDTKPEPDQPAADGKKFVIEKVNVTNMKVTGALTMPGGTSVPVDIKVPDFTLTDIGKKDNGVVMKEVIAIVLEAVLIKAIEGVGNIGGVGLDMFEGGADALKNIGAGALEGVGGLGGEAGKAVEGILGGNKDQADDGGEESGGVGGALKEGLGGMLGGDKDKEDQPKE
jgi:hypothetical protein